MNTRSLIDILYLQRNYLGTLLEQLTTELMDIGCGRATDAPPRPAIAAAHVMMLGAHSQQLVGEIERLRGYVATLEATRKDARAASLGS